MVIDVSEREAMPSATYWSATTDADDPAIAWTLYFGAGTVTRNGKAFTFHLWCVRSGGPLDNY